MLGRPARLPPGGLAALGAHVPQGAEAAVAWAQAKGYEHLSSSAASAFPSLEITGPVRGVSASAPLITRGGSGMSGAQLRCFIRPVKE